MKALEMAKTGMSYRAIGQALGVSHEQAHRDVLSELNKLNALSSGHAEEYRRLQLEQLDELLSAIWSAATSGDLAAQGQVLRIFERQSRLLGLDAPQRIDIEARIRATAEQLGLDPDAAVAEAARILREAKA